MATIDPVDPTVSTIDQKLSLMVKHSLYWHFLAPLLKIELILLLAMTLEMVW
jgi:hypothetical protein